MRIRPVLVALAIVAGLGILLAGCGQSNEQADASSCSGSSDGVSVTCEGKDGGMECAVTCSGAEGSSEYVVTCEGHDGSRECTVTCEGTDGKKEVTITCDGKTVTCEHADGRECTCTPTASGCPGVPETADAAGTCPGTTKATDSGGSCAMAEGSSCPRSGASRVTEGSGR